jgi:hypothetical protein
MAYDQYEADEEEQISIDDATQQYEYHCQMEEELFREAEIMGYEAPFQNFGW